MTSVYEDTNFKGRVNLAATYISAGRSTTRTFDTCFEMHDGDVVVVALMRRADANPNGRLARNLFDYLSKDSVEEQAEKLAAIPTRDLPNEAARQRQQAKKQFDEFMRKQHAA